MSLSDVTSHFTGGHYKPQSPEAVTGLSQSPRFNLRQTGLRFLQRLSGLRQSAKRSRVAGPHQDHARLPLTPGQFDDSDRVFFRGFSGADKLCEYESARPQPSAPPRRKKSRLTRSFSLTYGDIVVKKVSFFIQSSSIPSVIGILSQLMNCTQQSRRALQFTQL